MESDREPRMAEHNRPRQEKLPTPIGAEQMAEQALASASRAVQAIGEQEGAKSGGSHHFPEITDDPVMARDAERGGHHLSGLELLHDLDLAVRIELGRTRMLVEDVLRLRPDAVIELDRAIGEPVDVYVNDRHVARGEVLVVDDHFCVRVTEIVPTPGDETPSSSDP